MATGQSTSRSSWIWGTWSHSKIAGPRSRDPSLGSPCLRWSPALRTEFESGRQKTSRSLRYGLTRPHSRHLVSTRPLYLCFVCSFDVFFLSQRIAPAYSPWNVSQQTVGSLWIFSPGRWKSERSCSCVSYAWLQQGTSFGVNHPYLPVPAPAFLGWFTRMTQVQAQAQA